MKPIYKMFDEALEEIARRNDYDDKSSLLMDYGISPTVRVPAHKKIEFIPLILKYLKKRNE